MKTLRHVVTLIVTFILGLEIGGFGMWYISMTAIRSKPNKRPRYSYSHSGSDEKY